MSNYNIFSSNIVFISEVYQRFLKDENSVDSSWIHFFRENKDEIKSILADYNGPSWKARDLQVVGSQEFDISSLIKKEQTKKDAITSVKPTMPSSDDELLLRVLSLISSYKKFAHLSASLDPLGLATLQNVPEINPENHRITEEDLEKIAVLSGVLGFQKAKISEIISRLNFIYTRNIGAEFEYISDEKQKNWLSSELEKSSLSTISKAEKIKILQEIIHTERFEQFVHKRFPGAKRFSIEGCDSAICAIEKIIDVSAKNSVKKIVIGMAHRGRLSALTAVMKKPYHCLFSEFNGVPAIPESFTKSGDVKYHCGYSSTREIEGSTIDLSLAFNPSHLEAVNSVVTGRVRAKQDLYEDKDRDQALALVIHGDAAFSGQGSVAENLMMSGLSGYDTGGVIHLIINNQIGFTANPKDSRSTKYASDLAKSIDAPIFHINADDVENVVLISEIAVLFRQKFKKDVIIDLIGYRRYGHNEGDEPLYTQPVMYSKIKDHPTLEKIYSTKLIDDGVILESEHNQMVVAFEAHLSQEFELAKTYQPKTADWLKADWSKIEDGNNKLPNTRISAKKLKELIAEITKIPSDFNANPKILRQLEARKNAIENEKEIDWGTAEALAFATLLDENYPVRITGQDSGRGTFSHRHSVLFDAIDGSRYVPLNNVCATSAKFEVYDSILSEFAVLGFEYGYSLSAPYSLTIWEAQFGDFANGAQVIFDQFIVSSEVKWLRKSGLVMLLPHGYEGQGPEHSSARLERYLQACADNNLRVVNITNPANFFHCLRRQIHSKDRKPLVVMSPKSLLRHKLAVSTLVEFADFNFRAILSEESKIAPDEQIKKLILCSGKIYYDLFEARKAAKINDAAIIRLEQLYPFPSKELKDEIKKYKNADIIWCQEEPKNMGAWHFIRDLVGEVLAEVEHKFPCIKYVGRPACASPATGYGRYHAREQETLISNAFK
jgi:2-oxoglutarate dehydrogenase E1 component